jgi:hypothetical protein
MKIKTSEGVIDLDGRAMRAAVNRRNPARYA